MHSNLFHISGEAGMDGCVWMLLDDVLFIVHVIHNGLGGSRLLLWMVCMVFYGKSGVYWNLCYTCVYPTLFCASGEAGMDGWLWMALDDVSTVVIILSYLVNYFCTKKKNSSPYPSSSIWMPFLDNSCVGRYYCCLRHFTYTLCNKSISASLFLLEHVSRYIQTEKERKTERSLCSVVHLAPPPPCWIRLFILVQLEMSIVGLMSGCCGQCRVLVIGITSNSNPSSSLRWLRRHFPIGSTCSCLAAPMGTSCGSVKNLGGMHRCRAVLSFDEPYGWLLSNTCRRWGTCGGGTRGGKGKSVELIWRWRG